MNQHLFCSISVTNKSRIQEGNEYRQSQTHAGSVQNILRTFHILPGHSKKVTHVTYQVHPVDEVEDRASRACPQWVYCRHKAMLLAVLNISFPFSMKVNSPNLDCINSKQCLLNLCRQYCAFPYEGGEALPQVAQRNCGCPNPGGAQGQVRWTFEHPGLVKGVPTTAGRTV